MDRFWLQFLILIFICFIWTDTASAQEQCKNACVSDGKCRWFYVQSQCYYLFPDKILNWDESEMLCRDQGLHMTKINNENLNNDIQDGLSNVNLPELFKNYLKLGVWLGGKVKSFRSWSFLNGTSIKSEQLGSFAFRDSGYPQASGCGYLVSDFMSNVSINTQPCYTDAFFLCRIHNCETTANETCLRFIKEMKSWFEARIHCLGMGGDLFYLRENERLSQVESSPIYNEIKNGYAKVYVGIVHGQWEWNDGSIIFYTNWAPFKPLVYATQCLLMNGQTGQLEDQICLFPLLTLCQGRAVQSSNPSITMITTPPLPSTRSISIHDQESSTTQRPTSTLFDEQIIRPPLVASNSTKSKDSGSNTKLTGHDSKNNQNVIILGSLLGLLGLVVMIIAAVCVWKQRKMQTPQIENNVHSTRRHESPQEHTSSAEVYLHASRSDTPGEETSTDGVYQYISEDEIPKEQDKTTDATGVYHYASNEAPFEYLHPPRTGNHPEPPVSHNYLELVKY